jgi:hypothetical protein
MGPKAREWDYVPFSLAGEKAGWRRLIEVESKAMTSTQVEQIPDKVQRIVFRASATGSSGTAGVNAYVHLPSPQCLGCSTDQADQAHEYEEQGPKLDNIAAKEAIGDR